MNGYSEGSASAVIEAPIDDDASAEASAPTIH